MIALTARAAAEVSRVLAERHLDGYGLKLQLVGGGCEGFLYDLAYAAAPEPSDQVFESHGVKVFVDDKALAILDGSEIDHASTRLGEGFVFQNPRAARHCKCGASFRPR